MTKRRQRPIKEWGGVPGRKNSQIYAGGMGSTNLPVIDGVDVDIYMTGLGPTVAGQHGSQKSFVVEITVEQDEDLAPDIRTFPDEAEAILYARKYMDFLVQFLGYESV